MTIARITVRDWRREPNLFPDFSPFKFGIAKIRFNDPVLKLDNDDIPFRLTIE